MSSDYKRLRIRRRKLTFVVVGALIALLGTVASDLEKGGAERTLRDAQSELADLQYWVVRAFGFEDRAQHFDATAAQLSPTGTRGDAERSARDAAAQYRRFAAGDLSNRIESNISRARAEQNLLNEPVTPLRPNDPNCDQLRQTYTSGKPHGAGMTANEIGTIIGCYQKKIIRREVDLNTTIRSQEAKIACWTRVATYLQLLGIMIALLKDVGDP